MGRYTKNKGEGIPKIIETKPKSTEIVHPAPCSEVPFPGEIQVSEVESGLDQISRSR
jgi:hypothetical protein